MASLKDCISRAKLLLGISESVYDSIFELYANDAVRVLTCPDKKMYRFIECTPDTNGRIELPKGFIRPLLIRAHDSRSVEVQGNSRVKERGVYFVYVDRPFFNSCGYDFKGHFSGEYQVNGSFLQLHGDHRGCHKVELSYLSWNVDDHGAFIISEEWELAIQYFIMWSYSLMPYSNIPANLRKDYQVNWITYAKQCNSEAQVNRFKNERPKILSIMLSVINDKHQFFPA